MGTPQTLALDVADVLKRLLLAWAHPEQATRDHEPFNRVVTTLRAYFDQTPNGEAQLVAAEGKTIITIGHDRFELPQMRVVLPVVITPTSIGDFWQQLA